MMATYRRQAHRKNRRSAWDIPKVGGIVLGLAALGLVGAMIGLSPEPLKLDDETLCPESGPEKVTAIIVDTTNRVSPISRTDILERLEDLVAGSNTAEMMVAYETTTVGENSEGDENPLPPLVTVCNPGDPDEASEWTQNPRLVQEQFDVRFRQPLERVFSSLLVLSEPAGRSPLMENVQAISVTVFARQDYADIPKRLILISDLLQHSDNLSFYGRLPDYATFATSIGADALRTDLQGVDVEVMFIQRTQHRRFGDVRRLVDFWERWVSEQDGRLTRVSKIDGMN